jgi:hypothetical protein
MDPSDDDHVIQRGNQADVRNAIRIRTLPGSQPFALCPGTLRQRGWRPGGCRGTQASPYSATARVHASFPPPQLHPHETAAPAGDIRVPRLHLHLGELRSRCAYQERVLDHILTSHAPALTLSRICPEETRTRTIQTAGESLPTVLYRRCHRQYRQRKSSELVMLSFGQHHRAK